VLVAGPEIRVTSVAASGKLFIAIHGDQQVVYSVRLARFGEVFQTVHPSAGRGNGVAEAISVRVAKK